MLLLSAQLLSAMLNFSHSLFLCLWDFFPFNSHFWLKKRSAWECRPSQLKQLPTQLGVCVWLCLLSLVSTCFSCRHFTLGWAPTLHGTFACSALLVTSWSLGVRRGGWGRRGLQSEQTVPAWFIRSHPMPQRWQWVSCVPPPALQEGGHAVMSHFLGSTSCGGHHGYWGGVGTTTLEQEGLEWLLRSKLVSLCVKTWRKRRRV